MFSNRLRKQKQVLKFFILPPANLGTSLYVTQRFGLSYSCHVSTGTHLSLLQTYIMITINISFSCVISVCSLLYRSHLHQPMPGTSAPLSACTAPLQSQPIRRVFQAHSVHFHMSPLQSTFYPPHSSKTAPTEVTDDHHAAKFKVSSQASSHLISQQPLTG